MFKEGMTLFEEICKDIDLASDRQQKVARLQEAAKTLGVDLTSRNYHHCYDLVIEYNRPALEQVKTMIDREVGDRKFFIDLLLDPWCKRHNLTREQALSIICDDGSYNKNAPEKQMVTKEDLFCGAAMNTWYHMFLNKCYTDQSIEKGGLS